MRVSERFSSLRNRCADLRELVAFLVTPLAPDPSRLKVDGPETQLPGDATTPFALILHELATNARNTARGRPSLGSLSWNGPTRAELSTSVIAPPMRDGLGRTLIKSSFPAPP